MVKGRLNTHSEAVEMDNRREVVALKEAVHQLSTAVALNTAATQNLTAMVDKEFNRHTDDRKGLAGRVTVVEGRIDNVEKKMDQDVDMKGRVASLEALGEQLENRMNLRDGYSAGVKWMLGLCLPCAGWVVAEVFEKVLLPLIRH